MSRGSVPILMYHLVSPRAPTAYRKYTVSPVAFAAQMRWLRRAGYQAIDLDQLLTPAEALPPRAVVVTFDDGYEDCLRYAVPALEANGLSAYFYLIGGLVGKTSDWLLREKGFDLPLLDWQAARRLEAQGFHLGAHGMSHARLAELDAESCRRELVEARSVMEGELGHAVQHLAYPYGSCNRTVRELAAQAGYRSGCLVSRGRVEPGFDPLALRRLHVGGQDSLLDFVWRLRTGWPFGEWVRGKAGAVGRRLRDKQKELQP